jgi:tetratricopeptide (TPR) repeat protein
MTDQKQSFLRVAALFSPDIPLPLKFLRNFLQLEEDAFVSLLSDLQNEGILVVIPAGTLLPIEQHARLRQEWPPDCTTIQTLTEAVSGHLRTILSHHSKFAQLQGIQPLGPHLLTVIEAASACDPGLVWPLQQLLGTYLTLIGKHDEACLMFDNALAIAYALPTTSEPALHHLIAQCAQAHSAEGNQTQASVLYADLLSRERSFHGAPTPATLEKAAQTAFQQAEFARAVDLYQQAILAELTQSGDPNLVASRWNNLGRIYLHQENTAAAIDAFHTAADLWSDNPASEHHVNQALALKNLAMAYQQSGDLVNAQDAIERAIALSEQTYGSDHSDIGRDANLYAQILQAQGKLPEALQQSQRALRINRRVFGDRHPEVALTLNNLGVIYAELGELIQARQCLQETCDILSYCSDEYRPQQEQAQQNLSSLDEATP